MLLFTFLRICSLEPHRELLFHYVHLKIKLVIVELTFEPLRSLAGPIELFIWTSGFFTSTFFGASTVWAASTFYSSLYEASNFFVGSKVPLSSSSSSLIELRVSIVWIVISGSGFAAGFFSGLACLEAGFDPPAGLSLAYWYYICSAKLISDKGFSLGLDSAALPAGLSLLAWAASCSYRDIYSTGF